MRLDAAQALCPWLTEEDYKLIKDLSLPDPYHWNNMQTWIEQVLKKFHGRRSDSSTVRQRFIRTKCVACRHFCEDVDVENVVDPPVALPCGHVMGWTCYSEFVDSFVAGEGSGKCPWDGPRDDEPQTWSRACGESVIYTCPHPFMFARIPPFGHEFYLPAGFFIRQEGHMPDKCRECMIKHLLMRWTRELWKERGRSNVVVYCAGFNGLTEGERRRLYAAGDYKTKCEGHSKRLTEYMEELFESTPANAENGVLEELEPAVWYYAVEPDVVEGMLEE